MLTRLADGYAISDGVDIPGEGISSFVFGRGWLLEVIDVLVGDYYFISDGVEIRPAGDRFGAFYPPFTFVRAGVKNFKGRVVGVGSEKPNAKLPSYPVMFETAGNVELKSAADAVEVLDRAVGIRSIEVNTRPSLVTVKAKRLIDENFLIYPSIARIADRLGVSHEHLSRQFKKDFGLTPSQYLHQLRIAEATFRLSLGEEIIEISGDVGYNDLSRFYKQFRKKYGVSPGRCRGERFEKDQPH